MSYVLFPQVAREYFEWRARDDGLESELIAAITAALTHDGGHALPGHTRANGHAQNAWKMAGRQRALGKI